MIEIVEVAGAYHVVDKSKPGWVLLEQHGEKARAEMALQRRLITAGHVIECGEAEAEAEEEDEILIGNVATVRARLAEIDDDDRLADLERIEETGLGRKTILVAIDRRRRALA